MFKNIFSKALSSLPQILVPLFISLLAIIPQVAQAGTGQNVSGWAWSGNIGWISFNSTNCDPDGDGFSDGTPAGCPAAGTAITNYGVNISPTSGWFAGYAWSENIGWIDFASTGPYPASPNYPACVDFPGAGQACDGVGNYKVSGWARALSYGGGWDGWIKLRDSSYGVWIDSKTGAFQDWAWGSDVIEWISFKGVNYGVVTSFAFNSPPQKPGIPSEYLPDGVSWNHCSYKEKSIPTFHWIYSDPDGDTQAAYEIWLDDNSSFTDPKFNHLVNLAATSYTLNLLQDDNSDWITALAWNTTYFWRVRVKDSQGNWSEWSSSHQFKTPQHAYPWADFSWLPASPTQGEVVIFDSSLSQAYGEASIFSYLWTITAGTGQYIDDTSGISASPHIIFSTPDNKIKLAITDSDAYSCESLVKDVTAELPLPEYKEVPPLFWIRKLLANLVDFFRQFSII